MSLTSLTKEVDKIEALLLELQSVEAEVNRRLPVLMICFRQANKLTQKDLAQALGITQSLVTMVETGARKIVVNKASLDRSFAIVKLIKGIEAVDPSGAKCSKCGHIRPIVHFDPDTEALTCYACDEEMSIIASEEG